MKEETWVTYKGKKVRALDMTPTWESVLPVYIEVLRNPDATPKGIEAAETELYRLARAYDSYRGAIKNGAKLVYPNKKQKRDGKK